MRYVWIVLFALAVFVVVGCVTLNPEQEAARKEFKAELTELQAQAKRVEARMSELKEQYEKGELGTVDFFKLYDEAAFELGEARANISAVTASIKKLEALGVPWYYTAYDIALPILTVILGFAAKKFYGTTYTACQSIEKGGADKAAIKLYAANEGNSLLNRLVRKWFPKHSA